MTGLACFQNACVKSMFGEVYCCDSMNCPAGMFCQSKSGQFGRCGMSGGGGGPGGGGGGPGGGGGGPGGGGGGGSPGFCQYIPCMSSTSCMQAGCKQCGANGRCE
jgi:hypothetical protein